MYRQKAHTGLDRRKKDMQSKFNHYETQDDSKIQKIEGEEGTRR